MTDLFKLILGILASRWRELRWKRKTWSCGNRSMCFAGERRSDRTSTIRIVFYLFGSIAGFRPSGVHSFNDIHRGLPLISRAVLVARLRELEDHGVIERRPRGADGAGHEYWLTPAGEGLRMVMHALGQWGMSYTHDRIKRSDLDPALLIWGLRKRVDLSTLPDRRVVLRFEFSGVPASRTKFRIMWLSSDDPASTSA